MSRIWIACLTVSMSGCLGLMLPKQDAASASQERSAYCNKLAADRYDASWTEENKFLYAFCLDVKGDAYEDIENDLDHVHPPPLEVATMINFCVKRGKCQLTHAKDWYDPYCVPQGGSCNFSPSNAANMLWWANQVDPNAVAAALARVNVPEPFKAAFVAAYDANRKVLADSVALLDASRKRIYVQTVADAWRRRHADEVALASYYERASKVKPMLDRALLDHTVTRVELDGAIALRDDYIRACVKRGRTALYCIVGPVSRPLTKLIVRLAIAVDDRALAETENEMLKVAPSQEAGNTEIHVAVSAAMQAEGPRYREWVKAKEAQTDPKVLADKFGGARPAGLRDETNQAGAAPPGTLEFGHEIAAMKANPVERVARKLAHVEPRGNRALLVFADNATTSEEETNCYETNRISSVDKYGNVTYRTNCTGPVVKRVHHDQPPPIDVPAAEAASLRAGSFVVAIASKQPRRGHVVLARVSEKEDDVTSLLQVRQFPIPH